MKICGIITEYNPLHNGHVYHLEQSRKLTQCDYVVAVMSGNFTQRGEPAVFDKQARAKAALLGGADIVIELPTVYAVSSAEFFAHCAVKLLNDLNCVESLCFGAETDDFETLKSIASLLIEEPKQYADIINLNRNLPFFSAREKAVTTLLPQAVGVLSKPNNILAVEYLKALKKLSSPIEPYALHRTTSSYSSAAIRSSDASAMAIRKDMANGNENWKKAVPSDCADIYENEIRFGKAPIFYEPYFSYALNYNIRLLGIDGLKNIFDVSEGLEHKIYSAVSENAFSISDITACVKSKKYAQTRLQRIFARIILNIKADEFLKFNDAGFAQYARVLGFKRDSLPVLKEITKKSKIPVIVNAKKDMKKLDKIALEMFKKDLFATDIYASASPNAKYKATGRDFSQPLVIM